MSAGKFDLLIEKGATFRRPLYWSRGETPVDLTGYAARMQIRSSLGGDLLMELTTENGRIAFVPSEGRIELFIAATDTEQLAGANGVYDLELEKDGEVTRLLEGSVTLAPEVTR